MSNISKLLLPRVVDRSPDAPNGSRFEAPEPSRDGIADTAAISMDASPRRPADRRESPRVHLQLKLAVVYPQHEGRPARPMFHGRTHDIGMSGLSIVVGYNVFQEGEVTVAIALPLTHAGTPRKVVTSTAEMTYAIHSSKLDAFKIGLMFREFRGNGKQLLEAALRHALKDETADRMHTTSARFRAHRPRDSQPLGC